MMIRKGGPGNASSAFSDQQAVSVQQRKESIPAQAYAMLLHKRLNDNQQFAAAKPGLLPATQQYLLNKQVFLQNTFLK
jgi:hypothetical protein